MNAAKQLHALLTEWEVKARQTPEAARGRGNGTDTIEFWRTQARAVELCRTIERDLDELESLGDGTGAYRKALASWYAAIFTFTAPWKSTVPDKVRKPLSAPGMDLLEACGDAIESLGIARAPSPAQVSELLPVLNEAEKLAREDTALSKDLRRYVLTLVAHTKIALAEGSDATPEETKRLTTELVGALTATGLSYGPGEVGNAWLHLAYRITGFLNQPLPAALIAAVVTKAIGS